MGGRRRSGERPSDMPLAAPDFQHVTGRLHSRGLNVCRGHFVRPGALSVGVQCSPNAKHVAARAALRLLAR